MLLFHTNKRSKILMAEHEADKGFLAFQKTIGDIGWLRTITGITFDGFLYVDKRIPKSGYYELPAKFIPFEEIESVVIKRYFSIPLLIVSLVLLLALITLSTEVIQKPKGILLLLLLGSILLFCVFNLVRNRIIVKSQKTYRWTAPFFNYRKSIDICSYVAYCCEINNTPYRSHISPSMGQIRGGAE